MSTWISRIGIITIFFLIHPDFNAVVLSHTGHYPMLERPKLFNRHLEKILKNLGF
jgi:pimeloyl-ACP methyl ester carboxylesterase